MAHISLVKQLHNWRRSSRLSIGSHQLIVKPSSTETHVSWGSWNKPLEGAQSSKPLPCGSWSLVLLRCYHGNRPRILLELLRDHKREREENERRRIVSVLKGGIDCKRSNNGSKWKEKQDSTHKGEGSNALYSCFHPREWQWEWRPSQHDLSFIHGLLKGCSTLKLP